MRLNIKIFALTCGIFWGLGLFLLAWWLIWLEGGSSDAGLLGRMYPGYAFDPKGSLFGILWGFVDGMIGGTIFSWLYNRLLLRTEHAQTHSDVAEMPIP